MPLLGTAAWLQQIVWVIIRNSTGDIFDVAGGYLECRYVHGAKLQWIKINKSVLTVIRLIWKAQH